MSRFVTTSSEVEVSGPVAKRHRRRRRIVIAAGIALLAYPVIGTLALWTGLVERIVASEDMKVELDNPAWTIWPGHMHAAGARILVNGETQFELRAKNLRFDVRLYKLLKRHLHITWLTADDVRYWMRVQVESTKGIEERVAAYPPLEDLPGNNTMLVQEAAKDEERESDFTVEVEGIDVRVAELWFMEYHFVGDGTLQGAFLVGPQRMRVSTSVQELGPGDLFFGKDQIIAKAFEGRIEATIPDINPEEHADAGFLELVDANIQLKADIQTLEHVRAYLDGLKVSGGAGPFNTRLLLSKGQLGDRSMVTFHTETVTLQGSGFGVETDWDLDARVATEQQADRAQKDRARQRKVASKEAGKHDQNAAERKEAAKGKDEENEETQPQKVAGKEPQEPKSGEPPSPRAAKTPDEHGDEAVLPRLRSTSESTYVSISNDQGVIFTIQVHGHREEATLASTQVGSMTDIKDAKIRMPRIETNDMDDLAAVTADGAPFESKEGSARASLRLDIDDKHIARGPFNLDFDGVRIVVAGVRLSGDGEAKTVIWMNLDKQVTVLRDTALKISNAGMHVGDEHVEDWWMRLSSGRFTAWGLPPERFETELVLKAKDAEPILESLAEKDKLNDLIAKFTSLDDLTIRAKLRKSKDVTDLVFDPMESDVFDASGRIYMSGDSARVAMVVGGKAVSLGIATNESGTTLKPFAKADWLNEQLRTFPKPHEQARAPAP